MTGLKVSIQLHLLRLLLVDGSPVLLLMLSALWQASVMAPVQGPFLRPARDHRVMKAWCIRFCPVPMG
eukprot:gene18921-biopygen5733